MIIPLTKGQKSRVDKKDYPRVKGYRWRTLDLRKSRRGLMYAVTSIKKKVVYLHRFLMRAGKGDFVDHKNGDGLDNRRKENLRFRSRSGNAHNPRGLNIRNTSGVNGVCWSKSKKKFRAEIKVDGEKHYLGYFALKTDATKARKEAEKRLIHA